MRQWFGFCRSRRLRVAALFAVASSLAAPSALGATASGSNSYGRIANTIYVDYNASILRYYYDGLCSWCTAGYSAGQEWNSIGAWFNPQPWLNVGQLDYVSRVMGNLDDRPWENPGF